MSRVIIACFMLLLAGRAAFAQDHLPWLRLSPAWFEGALPYAQLTPLSATPPASYQALDSKLQNHAAWQEFRRSAAGKKFINAWQDGLAAGLRRAAMLPVNANGVPRPVHGSRGLTRALQQLDWPNLQEVAIGRVIYRLQMHESQQVGADRNRIETTYAALRQRQKVALQIINNSIMQQLINRLDSESVDAFAAAVAASQDVFSSNQLHHDARDMGDALADTLLGAYDFTRSDAVHRVLYPIH